MFNTKLINKLANNKYLAYILVSFIILAIIIFPYLENNTKNTIKKYITNPNILMVLVLSCGILSFYNLPLAIIISFFILLVLSNNENVIEEGFSSDKKIDRPHYFMKHFGLDTKGMVNDLQKGLEENRKSKIKNDVKAIKSRNETHASSNNGVKIKKRIFDLQNDEDTNLINTREICKDIINRINYQYEDANYLKKYISSRIEEIVDLNNLLENSD